MLDLDHVHSLRLLEHCFNATPMRRYLIIVCRGHLAGLFEDPDMTRLRSRFRCQWRIQDTTFKVHTTAGSAVLASDCKAVLRLGLAMLAYPAEAACLRRRRRSFSLAAATVIVRK